MVVARIPPVFRFMHQSRSRIEHKESVIELNLKNRKANTNYGLATGDLNAFLLLKVTG
jgi:hypothetical protein